MPPNSFVLFFLTTVILCTQCIYIDRKCTEAGLMCKDCYQIKLCTRNGSKLQEETIGNCNKLSGSTCFNGKCIKDHPICNNRFDNFNCQDIGYYPDPYNCQMYHHCIRDEKEIIDKGIHCPDGFSYNTRTETCDIPLRKNQCPETLVPECERIGQDGTVLGNKNIYFICKVNKYSTLLPYLYKCPDNRYYDGNYGCY